MSSYVKADSIQSTQSPAADLKHIYDLGTGITNSHEELNLNRRRLDLDNLVLSEDNLHEEVTTLSLANELLMVQALYGKKNVLYFEGPCGMEAPQDIDLTQKSYTIEFWARRIQEKEDITSLDFKLIAQAEGNIYIFRWFGSFDI